MMKKKITKREWRLALFKDEIINSQYDKRYLVLALSRSLSSHRRLLNRRTAPLPGFLCLGRRVPVLYRLCDVLFICLYPGMETTTRL